VSPGAQTHPLTAERWDDAATVFGTRGDPARCWCQWFRMRNPAWRGATAASNRAALRVQAAAVPGEPPPGVLGYLDGEPAGWCGFGPRPAYPRVLASRLLRDEAVAADLADPGVWSVVCFVVRVGLRGQGLSARMLGAAVALAGEHGARALEAYPVDVVAKAAAGTSITSSELYHGTLSTFVNAGFREVARPSPTRPVVRLELHPTG
jgi:GNAT superfamily N-acetyltransferase